MLVLAGALKTYIYFQPSTRVKIHYDVLRKGWKMGWTKTKMLMENIPIFIPWNCISRKNILLVPQNSVNFQGNIWINYLTNVAIFVRFWQLSGYFRVFICLLVCTWTCLKKSFSANSKWSKSGCRAAGRRTSPNFFLTFFTLFQIEMTV